MGDSGAYLISFLFCFLLLEIHMVNPQISPYFIILLLWYPGFENLFSIIRKQRFKKSALKPDVYHLHQLIFYYFQKKIILIKNYISTITGLSINFYNLLIFLFASMNPYNTILQFLLIFVSVLTYISLYLILIKFKNNF